MHSHSTCPSGSKGAKPKCPACSPSAQKSGCRFLESCMVPKLAAGAVQLALLSECNHGAVQENTSPPQSPQNSQSSVFPEGQSKGGTALCPPHTLALTIGSAAQDMALSVIPAMGCQQPARDKQRSAVAHCVHSLPEGATPQQLHCQNAHGSKHGQPANIAPSILSQ